MLESATSVSSALLLLTKGVEEVSVHHDEIMNALCIDVSEDEQDEDEED